MKKSILAILIAITITACNYEIPITPTFVDINATGEYKQTIVAPLANGTFIHFETDFYSCIDGFVYKDTDTTTTVNDANGTAYACTPDIYLYATFGVTNDTLYTEPG